MDYLVIFKNFALLSKINVRTLVLWPKNYIFAALNETWFNPNNIITNYGKLQGLRSREHARDVC